MNFMITGLEGRLELVKILKNIKPKLSIGQLVKNPLDIVYVYGATKHLGKKCLVKFKPDDKNKTIPISNFIKLFHNNDKKYIGLYPNEFVLYGIRDFGHIPTLNEVNNYFDPGSIGRFFHFESNSSVNKGRYMVYRKNGIDKYHPIHKSIREFVNSEIIYNGRNPIVFIIESADDAYSLMKQGKRKGIEVIKMDYLAI